MSNNEMNDVKLAKIAIISFGLISLFGDIIYEGARSIIPSYLEILLAPAVMVGFALGLGEFLGYALRLVSGPIADTTRAYWALTIIGYCLLISIPLLALTTNWQIAIILVIIERIAKAIRTPARDTLLSVTTRAYGRGKAFGLHELLDQVGAILGPTIVVVSIFYYSVHRVELPEIFRNTFLILFLPYLCLLVVLTSGYLKMKTPTAEMLKTTKRERIVEPLTKSFYLYSFAVLLNTAGLFPVALILYRATPTLLEAIWGVALLYLLVQAVDAIFAVIAGFAYDKFGIKFLSIPFLLSIFPAVFIAFSFIYSTLSFIFIVISAAVFGIILGMQESIYRAAVADLTGITKRGTGYGIFNAMYGFGFLIGGTIFGYFLDKISMGYLVYASFMVWYSIVLQILSLVFLLMSVKK